jgi:hypothetical protein
MAKQSLRIIVFVHKRKWVLNHFPLIVCQYVNFAWPYLKYFFLRLCSYTNYGTLFLTVAIDFLVV